jgi:mono/diheme cytochrome c family protein
MPHVCCAHIFPTRRAGGIVVLATFLALPTPILAQGGPKTVPTSPVVPGFERFHAKVESASPLGGQLLLGELNCISCHTPDAARETVLLRRTAPLLDGVGSRVKAGFLRRFLNDPQAVKPGTAMPDVFAGLPANEKADNVEALVHFLASTGTLKQEKPQKKLIAPGRDLYHKVGCVVCHGTRDAAGEQEKLFPTSVPLGDLKSKYSLSSLRTFLENPHASRPAGRMPSLLNAKESTEVANYLLQGVLFQFTTAPNMKYAYYEGNWDNLPDFDKLKPRATGTAAGLDLSLALRLNNMAMRFEGFLKIDRDGDYRLHLTSDDGSKVFIDGKPAVVHDGIHPPSTMSGGVKLTKGVHKFVAAVFNGGGGVELDVDIEGPGLGRQPVSSFVFLTPEGNPGVKPPAGNKDDGPIAVQAPLAEKGRTLFASAGCASCHTLNLGKKIASTVQATPLAKLAAAGGCLSATPKLGVPYYPLSTAQRAALVIAIKAPAPSEKPAAADTIARTMTTFNCYACHERNKVGGVQETLNKLFTTAQPEMGDEGRLPPPLTGAGAKLTDAFLRHILDKGAHDRPYMFTRMPGFGSANVGALVAALQAADPEIPASKVAFSMPLVKIKAEARKLVGAGALACIKCHTFKGQKAEGVQGIDMTLMTQRLRKSWFHVYMLDPNKYRPGTRMPAAWPNGETFFPKFLEGTTAKQIEGIWIYLADGTKAPLPPGMKKLAIPLVPTTEAIVYRNFIEGAGPRAIAVGYPEQAHLAFDANNLRLAMIWQGAFMDASRHWTDRGAGFEPPAGDNIVHFANTVAFAALEKPDQAWPTKSGRDLPGYQFNGYRVTKDERPTFLYTILGMKIEDFPNAVTVAGNPAIRRTLTLKTNTPVDNVYFRAAAASKIVALGDGWYRINNEWKMRIESDAPTQIRQVGGQYELLVPVRFKDAATKIVQEFQW